MGRAISKSQPITSMDYLGNLILVVVAIILLSMIYGLIYCCHSIAKLPKSKPRPNPPRPSYEINAVESGLSIDVTSPNYDPTQTRFEPSVPSEEIYVIEIAPNMDTTDTKPPSYNDVMENKQDFEPPPSYLEYFFLNRDVADVRAV